MRRLAEELHAKWRNLCWTPRRPHGRKLWSKNAGRPRARLGAREEALERPGAPARVWDPSVRWMSRSHGMGNGLFGSKDIRDRSLGGQGKKLGRGRLGTCVGYSMNGRGPGSEGVRGSRPGPARAPGGIRSKRRGGVWRAGVRLRVPGCPRRCPRRRALTRGPAVGAVSVAGARRLQQLQQPLLVALAVAHGRLRGLSGAQPGCHPAGGSP